LDQLNGEGDEDGEPAHEGGDDELAGAHGWHGRRVNVGAGESFASVLSAAQAGGEWAWEVIYRQYAGPVRGYVRANGSSEPDDLVSEVFLQIARNLPGFDGDEKQFRSWIFTVAHHRVVDERRARGRRPSDPSSDGVVEPREVAVAAEELALSRLGFERARALVEGLSPDQRDVLLLRILGGQTVDEVAATLGKRRGAVKALQRRGLAALQRAAEAAEVTR
jgi:RNA polymerase sigma-70 factor, ECF subfamily